MASQQPADLAFFRVLDSLILSVVCISYTAVALLALNAFDGRLAVIAGLLLAAAGRYFLPASFEPEHAASGKPVFPVVLVVLLAALLFRAEPFRPMHGGQDQGVYVSMSAHLQREGSVFIDDPVPAALPDERLRGHLRCGPPGAPRLRLPRAARRLLVAVRRRLRLSVLPLAPAVDGDVRRPVRRRRTVLFAHVLQPAEHRRHRTAVVRDDGLALGGARRRPAAGGQPLHVFFSRLHVTEIVALAYSAIGFYYLARAARGVQRAAPPVATASLAALSALSLSLVFFVRITGFLYLPLVLLLYGLGVWWTAGTAGVHAPGRRLRRTCRRVVRGLGALRPVRLPGVFPGNLRMAVRRPARLVLEGDPGACLGWDDCDRRRAPVRRAA